MPFPEKPVGGLAPGLTVSASAATHQNSTNPENTPRKRIAIPSFREVKEATRSVPPPPNFFRSDDSSMHALPPVGYRPAERQRQPLEVFLGGSNTPLHDNQIPQPASVSAAIVSRSNAGTPQRPIPSSNAAGPSALNGGGPPMLPVNAIQAAIQSNPSMGASQPSSSVVIPVHVNPNAITVNRRQQGNPILKHIRNVRWQFGDIVPDYQLGQSTVALFLSLRYHLLRPQYVFSRMKELGRAFKLRVLLVYVDTEDAVEPLAAVTRAAIGNEFTLLCGFTAAECARYLETLKSYERKPAETIQKDLGTDYVSRATAALTVVRGVNRTDVKTLGDRFGSIAAIFQASETELKACPGIGPTKARRLYETFHEPFRRSLVSSISDQATQGLPREGGPAVGPPQNFVVGHEENDEEEDNDMQQEFYM